MRGARANGYRVPPLKTWRQGDIALYFKALERALLESKLRDWEIHWEYPGYFSVVGGGPKGFSIVLDRDALSERDLVGSLDMDGQVISASWPQNQARLYGLTSIWTGDLKIDVAQFWALFEPALRFAETQDPAQLEPLQGRLTSWSDPHVSEWIEEVVEARRAVAELF